MCIRDSIPPRIFKEMTQLTKQKEQLDALLVGITPFNGKSRAAETSKVLDSYIPNVARMKDQLRKYNVASVSYTHLDVYKRQVSAG